MPEIPQGFYFFRCSTSKNIFAAAGRRDKIVRSYAQEEQKMSAEILQFLIVCPLVFLAGFIDAIAGGGGLISLPAYMITGLPVHNAIATNKMSSSMGTFVATVKYARDGYICWGRAAVCVICALVGSTSGARLALMVSDRYFRIFLLVVLPLTAAYILFGKPFVGEKKPYGAVRTTLISMLTAVCIGVYDGFYGPGTGTFLLLLLTGAAHMKLTEANGTTKVINLTTNVSALAIFLLNGKVLLSLGITAGLFSIAGNYLGARRFSKGGASSVRSVMLIVLAIFFAKVLTELIIG